MKEKVISLLSVILSAMMIFTSCTSVTDYSAPIDIGYEYEGKAYVELSDNAPEFSEDEITEESFEYYSELDHLGRCGAAFACIGRDIMPTEERGAIGSVKPSGWQLVKYDNVDGKYLYNRCHLIGYQLTGENANEKNLITGTRYMNVEGMLPFENAVADYVKTTNNHVMYRVTPVFEGDNLIAKGVKMEALSVEDNGEGVCFNVFVFNVQPGILINYADGTSRAEKSGESETPVIPDGGQNHYVLNTNSGKIHYPECDSVKDIKPKNKKEYKGTREKLIEEGYTPCGKCLP